MKRLLKFIPFILFVSNLHAAPVPFHVDDPAVEGNFEELARRIATHKHNNDGSARMLDILPDTDSLYDLGASGREWANLYVDSITVQGLLYNFLPVGVIMPYASTTTIPSGWLQCQGQSVSTTTYSKLFAVTGYVYGGSGANFNLPDTRGIFLKGTGQQGTASFAGALYTGTNGAYTQDGMQGHRHDLNFAGSALDFIYSGSAGAAEANRPLTGTINQSFQLSIGSPRSDGSHGTPRTLSTTEPASLGINFIIYCGL